jgi:hypothetical protein
MVVSEDQAVTLAKRIGVLQRGLGAYTLYRASALDDGNSGVPVDVQQMRCELDELLLQIAKILPQLPEGSRQSVLSYCEDQ